MTDETALKAWFCREILPLEPALIRFIRRNWRNESDISDLRQEVYERVLEGASRSLPLQAKPFLFTVARNHLINSAKRAQIISFEVVQDLESSTVAMDTMTPDRHLTARDELRRVQAGLDRLPPRCREVVRLRKVEGLSTREVAARLGVGVDTVEQQTVHGMRALVDFMLGGSGKIQRGAAARRGKSEAP
jgi:RNA polymerase sigma factor (sigma-70 family)